MTGRKLTLEDMQRVAASRGGLCLSTSYARIHDLLEWQCSQGHRWRTSASNVRGGTWCPECFRIRKRGTLENMQAIAASRGGRCLSACYTDSGTPLEWECALGHRWIAVASNIRQGKWCPKCARRRRANTIENMQEAARQHGGQCLSPVYVNARTPLQWRCARGHCWQALPFTILYGSWCRQCHYDSRRDTLEKMQELAALRGGRCLSQRYVSSMTHLEWECARGHTWRAVPHSIINGTWCRQCAVLDRTLAPGKRRKYLDGCKK